jgi:hypothetical protein
MEIQKRIDQQQIEKDNQQIEKANQQCDSDPLCSQEKEKKRKEEEFNKNWYSGLYNYSVKPVGYIASPVVNTATNVVSSVPTVASNAVSGLGYLGSYVTDPMRITGYGQITEEEIDHYNANKYEICGNKNLLERTKNCIRNNGCSVDGRQCSTELGKKCVAFDATLSRVNVNDCKLGGKRTRKNKKSKKTVKKSKKRTKKSRKHKK